MIGEGAALFPGFFAGRQREEGRGSVNDDPVRRRRRRNPLRENGSALLTDLSDDDGTPPRQVFQNCRQSHSRFFRWTAYGVVRRAFSGPTLVACKLSFPQTTRQLAFGKPRSILISSRRDRTGRGAVAAETARKTKTKALEEVL